jgi:DNA polymerase-3 subunit chi
MMKIYFVETRSADKRVTLCRWVERFYEEGQRVQVVTDSTMAAQHLDQLLWTFADRSFVPHRILGEDIGGEIIEPVVITVGNPVLPDFQVVIPDGAADLDFLGQYPIAVHFVLIEDHDRRQESRLLWRTAKELRYELQHVPCQPA